MYQIIRTTDNVEIGRTERPRYIRKSSEGVYIEADEQTAQGVAYKSTPYNLDGRDGLGVEETVLLIACDAGVLSSEQQAAIAANSAAIDDILVDILEG